MKFLIFSILLSSLIISCNSQETEIRTPYKTYVFKAPQDSINIDIVPPDSINVIGISTKYKANWNDTIIDRGKKLSAREYSTQSDYIEYYGGKPYLKFWYQKYKATEYYIEMQISFIGYLKKKGELKKSNYN